VEALKVAVSKLNRKYLDEAARIASKQPKMKE
jgi:hypothetical protein